ncbi:MAG: folate family ECF transporter S component, partial [Clostridia bacterium]|nr:folate family ECF transporter S component [Clostridia bacterium]
MKKRNISLDLKILCQLAMLVAISIVMGKYLAIGIGTVLRFSLENLPVIFAGIAFGPIAGIFVGVAADLIGCLLVGYTINPILTIGAAVIGATSGLCTLLFSENKKPPSKGVTILSTVIAHMTGSVVIKTIGLAVFYDMPIIILMLWRLLNYAIVGAVEAVLLVIIFRNKQL